MRAVGTWMVGAMILCRPKKSQWQRGCPPSRASEGGVRESREGEEGGRRLQRGRMEDSKRDAGSIEFNALASTLPDDTMVDRGHESTVV